MLRALCFGLMAASLALAWVGLQPASVAGAAGLAETGALVVGGEPKEILQDPARRLLYVSDFAAGTVAQVDLVTGLVTRRLPAPEGPVGLQLSPDGTKLFVASYLGGKVYRIDVASGRLEAVARDMGDPWDLVLLDSDGRSLLAVTEHHGDRVAFLDPDTLGVVAEVPTGYYPYDMAADSENGRLYVAVYGGRSGGELLAVDTGTLTAAWTRSAGRGSFDVVVDHDRGILVVSDFVGDTLSSFTYDGERAGTQDLPGGPKELALSPDGSELLVALQTIDRVQALDPETGTEGVSTPVGSRPGALRWLEPEPSSETEYPEASGEAVLAAANQGDGTISLLSAGPPLPDFRDVPPQHWFYRPIRVLAVRGVLSGYAESGGMVAFRPDGTLMRAQLAKILVGALGLHTEGVEQSGTPFADVPAVRDSGGALEPYPYDYVQEAARAGIVTGFQGTIPRFKPYEPVTRIQLMRMVVRAAEAIGAPLPAGSGPSPFTDVTPGDPDYGTIVAAYEAGLVAGAPGADGRLRLRPWDPATRGHTASIVFNLMAALHRGEQP